MMMIRELGRGQKGASLCDWNWLSVPHMCLCPGTTVHCPRVPGGVGGHLSAVVDTVIF